MCHDFRSLFSSEPGPCFHFKLVSQRKLCNHFAMKEHLIYALGEGGGRGGRGVKFFFRFNLKREHPVVVKGI